MYNYYTELKRKQALEAKQKQDDLSIKLKRKRQNDLPKLVERYENRIKGFLYQMAEKPIQIKEVKSSVSSTREELFMENSNKIIGTKGFVFSTYKTDKQRAKEYTIKHKEDEFFQKIREASKQNYQIVQPTMRFKPRTDLERICDILGEFNAENKGKDIIFNQLSTVGLNVSKPINQPKPEDEDENDHDYESKDEDFDRDNNSLEAKPNAEQQLSQVDLRRNHLLYKKQPIKRIDNSEAKKIYADLYNKTYFKATENYSLFKNTCLLDHEQFNSKPSSNKESKSHKKKPKYIPAFTGPDQSDKRANVNYSTGQNPFQQRDEAANPTDLTSILNICTSSSSSMKNKEANLLKSLDNIDLFTQSIKTTQENKEKLDGEKLLKIREMAFMKEPTYNYHNEVTASKASTKRKPGALSNIKRKSFKEGTMTFSAPHNLYNSPTEDDGPNKVEEKIRINGEEYSKSDYNAISKRILFNCNWTHQKNKGVKESLKARNGKLMCTGGLTVEEFEKKYRLQTIY